MGRKVMAWTGKEPGAARTGVDGRGLRGEIVQQREAGLRTGERDHPPGHRWPAPSGSAIQIEKC